LNQATTVESQMIHMIQELFGQTLRCGQCNPPVASHEHGACQGSAARNSSTLIRMHPLIRRDLLRRGQLDHMHRRRVAPFLHDRHFSAASSFQIGVSRGRRMASSGRLALVLQRLHSTSSQPPPLRHCPIVGDGYWPLSIRRSRFTAEKFRMSLEVHQSAP
jgi:hypothetical protein